MPACVDAPNGQNIQVVSRLRSTGEHGSPYIGGGALGAPRHVYRELRDGNGEKGEPAGAHHAGCMVGGSQVAMIYRFCGRYISGTGG